MTKTPASSRPRAVRVATGPGRSLASPAVLDEQLVAAVEFVERYEPTWLTSGSWKRAEPLVRDIGRRLVHDHEQASTRYFMPPLTALAVWAESTGAKLTIQGVLDPYVIDQWTASRPANRTTNTYRSLMRRIGLLLNPAAPWDKPLRQGYRTVAPPYESAELQTLWTQILAAPTARRRAGEAVMLLGLGAGLDGRWSTHVYGTDVVTDDLGVCVKVHDRAVPVLNCCSALLRRIADDTADGDLLIGGRSHHRNQANEIVARLKLDPSGPRLLASRLRSTWLVAHLTRGTRLPELVAAAGLKSATTLTDLLPFVPALDDDAAECARLTRLELHH